MTLSEKSTARIEIIDVLRGFTLLGIIIVHFVEQYYAGAPPQKAANYNVHFVLDGIVQTLVFIFITGKFYMIFSFLFGLSFFIQFSKSDGSGRFYIRFIWRLIILFAIGWLHTMHYRGDILTIYAILGLGLLLFHKLPDKALWIVALALIINIPSFITRGINVLNPESASSSANFGGNEQANEIYFDTIKEGNYLEILKANVPEFMAKMDFQVESGRIYITLGLFLLGLYAGRKKVFENLSDNHAFFRKYRKVSLWSILGLFLFAAAFFGGAQLLKITIPDMVSWMVGGLAYDMLNACQAFFYTATLLLLYDKENWNRRLTHFYAVGRMGLTTYLTQTVFGVLIFFGIGLNLLNGIGATASLAIALMLFILQVFISKWWLARFNYGPVEWLWRSLTYWKWQPMKDSSLNS